jgi:nitrogen fixation/metabolism regulation signal transduction histidine kinase
MKKKIVLGLSILAVMLCLSGVLIVTTLETTIEELRYVAQLHHVPVLSMNLLRSIEIIQHDIDRRVTRAAGGAQTSRDHVRMIEAMAQCRSCHHRPVAAAVIGDLQSRLERYGEDSLRFFSPFVKSAPQERRAAVLRQGDELVKTVERIVTRTSANLENKEAAALRAVRYRRNVLLLMFVLSSLFAAGLAVMFMNGFTGPVKSLLGASRRLKAGDFDYRIEGLKDEFSELAASFNEMAASLKNQMREMQRTEQLKACGEMAAGLAHEIRNPLAGIKVSIEVLLAELALAQRDRDVLSGILEQIKRIETLMKNLLNYARPMAAEITMVDVKDLLGNMISLMERHPTFSSGEKRKQIVRELDADLPQTTADPQQLQQVFLNLLLNASDAIADSGAVTVRTFHDQAAEAIVVDVQDTGTGIPEELQGRIFQPFFTTKKKGTGLGLAVSKRLIEDNGGSIAAMNNAAGGATFRVMLPVNGGCRGMRI